jgi:hypothetical protein
MEMNTEAKSHNFILILPDMAIQTVCATQRSSAMSYRLKEFNAAISDDLMSALALKQ